MVAVSRRQRSAGGPAAPGGALIARVRTDAPTERTAMTSILALRDRPAWIGLGEHYNKIREVHLRDLFAGDPGRGERMTAEAAGLYLDYSKNRVTDETVDLLTELAKQSGLAERTEAMFAAERINTTENRSVLHVALRMPKDAVLLVDGTDVVAQVHEVLDQMAAFANQVRSGEW